MIAPPQSRQYRNAERIVRRLQQAGERAVLAGGCVRDLLQGEEPKDYDVATSATPERVEELFAETRQVGRRFGTILVLLDDFTYEVTTFRREETYSDGRHPDEVHFTTLEQDAQRRDFTVNAMYWDPISGELIDLIGGVDDLREGVVRAVGEAPRRMREDHLRIIRAVRFAARYGFEIEAKTARALRSLGHLLEEVAAERLQQELRIILTDRSPARALRIMDALGLLVRIFPELEPCRGCEQPKNYHPEGDVFVHTLLTVEKLGPHPDFEVAMAALLHDVGKPPANEGRSDLRFPEHERIGRDMAREVCRRLRLSRAETERICWLVKRHMYFKDAEKMKDSTLKRLFAEPGFEQLCALVRADALASWGRLDHLEYVLKRREDLSEEEIEPPRLLTGEDLIEMGYAPGPAFGTILEEVRDRQLEGELGACGEARRAARRIAERIDAPRAEDHDGPSGTG